MKHVVFQWTLSSALQGYRGASLIRNGSDKKEAFSWYFCTVKGVLSYDQGTSVQLYLAHKAAHTPRALQGYHAHKKTHPAPRATI